MSERSKLKEMVSIETALGRMDARVGAIIAVEAFVFEGRSALDMTIDFGRFGIKRSVGNFSETNPTNLVGLQVVGVLNLPEMVVKGRHSQCLILGVQRPGSQSGEAVYLTPRENVKIGSKVF